MRAHEGLELLMSALDRLLRWNLGRKRYSERHLDSDKVVKIWTAGEAFDVAFEASAENKSRLENSLRRAVLVQGNHSGFSHLNSAIQTTSRMIHQARASQDGVCLPAGRP